MWPNTEWIMIPGWVTLLSPSSRSLNYAVTKLVSSDIRKSHTGWTLPVVEQSRADGSSCVVSDSFCLMAMPVPLTIAGWSPGPWSQRAFALLLICHHWTQCQSLLAGWQNKRGAALPDCSWKVPPLRPDIYRSPRGIHTHCHLSPKAIWGYRPCFTALIQHMRSSLSSGASAGARWEHLAIAHSTFPRECRAAWNWAQGWLIRTTAKRNTKFSISLWVQFNS